MGCDNTEIAAYHWFRRFGPVFGSDTKLIDRSLCIAQDSLMAKPLQSISPFGSDNTEIVAYQWFRRFGPVFGSDTKLIDPSFCILRDNLLSNHRAKLQRFW